MVVHRLESSAPFRAVLVGVLTAFAIGGAVLALQVATGVDPGRVPVVALVAIALVTAFVHVRLRERVLVGSEEIVRYAMVRSSVALGSVREVELTGRLGRNEYGVTGDYRVLARLTDGSEMLLCASGRVFPFELLVDLRGRRVRLGPRATEALRRSAAGPRPYWQTADGGAMYTRLSVLLLGTLFGTAVGFAIEAIAQAI